MLIIWLSINNKWKKKKNNKSSWVIGKIGLFLVFSCILIQMLLTIQTMLDPLPIKMAFFSTCPFFIYPPKLISTPSYLHLQFALLSNHSRCNPIKFKYNPKIPYIKMINPSKRVSELLPPSKERKKMTRILNIWSTLRLRKRTMSRPQAETKSRMHSEHF